MSTAPEQGDDLNPRAFVTASGFVFQVVGVVSTLGGCCLWSMSGLLQQEAAQPVLRLADYFRGSNFAQTVAMVDTVVTFLAGLGLLATGLGMQAETPDSGRRAMVVSGLLAAVWWVSLPAYLAVGASWWTAGSAVVFAGLSTVLFLLAGNSARILKEHPPPADRNVVTDEFLDEYARRRPE